MKLQLFRSKVRLRCERNEDRVWKIYRLDRFLGSVFQNKEKEWVIRSEINWFRISGERCIAPSWKVAVLRLARLRYVQGFTFYRHSPERDVKMVRLYNFKKFSYALDQYGDVSVYRNISVGFFDKQFNEGLSFHNLEEYSQIREDFKSIVEFEQKNKRKKNWDLEDFAGSLSQEERNDFQVILDRYEGC